MYHDTYYWVAGIGGGIVLLTYILGYFWGVYTERTLKPVTEGWGGIYLWLLWVAVVAASVVYINITAPPELSIEIQIMWYAGSAIFWLGAVTWVPTLKHQQDTGNGVYMQISLNATAAGSLVWLLLVLTLAMRKPSPQMVPQVVAAILSAMHHTIYDAIYWYNEYID